MENNKPQTDKDKLNSQEASDKASDEATKSILITLAGGISISLVGLIGYPLQIAGISLTLLFLGILIACASFITGFFTGNLFGIPKRNKGEKSDYDFNNSLVEIADWLTKIIVGLGLVNLKQIPKYLLNLGTYVNDAVNIQNGGKSASVYTMCVVIFYSVFGLYIGYNYMRLVLSGKYKKADDNVYKNPSEDIDEYRKLFKPKSKDFVSIVNKGINLDSKDKQMLSDYTKLIRTSKTEDDYDFDDWYYKGIEHFNNNEWEFTIACMKHAIEVDSKNTNV